MNFRYFLILGLTILSGCEAPHDNPNDPESDNYSAIKGYVQSFSLPYTPIKEVAVYWAPSNSMVKTDHSGRFTISNVTNSNGYLTFQKPGYRTDSLLIEWNEAKTVDVHLDMNKIPILDSSFIYTSVINHPDETKSFELLMNVTITDEDKDIDSVTVENPKLQLKQALEYDVSSKKYYLAIPSDELALNNVEDIIGEEFTFFVSDIFGNIDMVGNDHVTRIISSAATIVSPDNNATVDSVPLLRWNKFTPGYALTYTVDVFKSDPANPQLIFRRTGISQDSTSVRINPPLSSGDYFWVIWSIDSFKNSCRSKPAAFNVR